MLVNQETAQVKSNIHFAEDSIHLYNHGVLALHMLELADLKDLLL